MLLPFVCRTELFPSSASLSVPATLFFYHFASLKMDLITEKGNVESVLCWLASLVSASFKPIQCGWLSTLMCLASLQKEACDY